LSGQPLDEWRFRRDDEVVEVKTTGRLMVSEFGTMLGACLSGVGIARVKAIGVQHLIQKGALVELLSDWPGESYPLYALYPSRNLPAAKVRAFIDFVQSRLNVTAGAADEASEGGKGVRSSPRPRSPRPAAKAMFALAPT
jgi:DNA-binding transcriptional LysR family regulator